MTQMPWSCQKSNQGAKSGLQSPNQTSSYDDETRPHPYRTFQNLSAMDATYPQILPLTTPRVYVEHALNDPHLPLTPRDDPLRLMSTSYSPAPPGIETSDDAPMGFLQPSELEYLWGSFYASPNLPPSSIQDFSPPAFHHSQYSTLDPAALYRNFNFPQPPLSTGHIQVSPVDESLQASSHHHSSALPIQNSAPSPLLPLVHISQPGSRALSASYPCQWTEGGVICSIMVQATRPHMNRHLHEQHGFGGSDTRQMSCCWAGCGETMQQGSIARHTVTCHFQAKVTCPMCSKKLSRQDVISKHQRICPAASARR